MPWLDRVVLPAKLEKIACYLLRILSYRDSGIKVFLILSLALASYFRRVYFAALFNTTKPDLT
jgi:hypothetical protein